MVETNGATAEPCVSTGKPPRAAIRMRIGKIQYFLRAQETAKFAGKGEHRHTAGLRAHGRGHAKMVAPAIGRRPDRVTLDSIGGRRWSEVERQEILAGGPHQKAGRQCQAQ
jgi:hypothetical protein